MGETLVCNKPEDMAIVAKKLLDEYANERIFTFHGDLGAGKTTMIKHLCQQLKVVDVASSPTFAIINEYLRENKSPVYHFDFYRLDDESEAINIGALEYFDSGEYCFIEWPEKVNGLIPESHVRVSIEVDRDKRIVRFDKN